MLFSNQNCINYNSQVGVLQQAHFRTELQKQGNMSLVAPLFTLFQESPQLCLGYATEAFQKLMFSGVVTAEMWQTHYAQFATYGFALSNMFYVYDTNSGNLTMQTSSLSLLEKLRDAGKLVTKDGKPIEYDVEKWHTQLDISENAIRKSIVDGSVIRTVKLEPQDDGTFITVIPRSPIKYLESIIVPYNAMKQCLLDIRTLADNQLLKVVTGDKTRYVSSNAGILSKMYDSSRVATLLRGIRTGDTYIYLPSLGESIYTPGLTKLDVISLDVITAGQLASVDTSSVNVNYDKARLFLLSKVTNVDMAHKILFALNGTDSRVLGFGGITDTRDYLRNIINYTFESEVYKVIVSLGFSDEYVDFHSPVGDVYQEIEVPKSVSQLRARLDTGVYKIVIARKDGKFSSVIGTNCSKLLSEVYGRGYVAVFESDGVKLSKFSQAVLKRDGTLTSADLIKLVSKYSLPALEVELEDKYPFPEAIIDSEGVLKIIETHQLGVESRKTTKPNPNLVLVRNCFATLENGRSRDYYKNIDVRSIQAMYKLSKDDPSNSSGIQGD